MGRKNKKEVITVEVEIYKLPRVTEGNIIITPKKGKGSYSRKKEKVVSDENDNQKSN
jgi:hypothetical protein